MLSIFCQGYHRKLCEIICLESTFKTATLLRAALVIEAGIDLCFVFVRSPWLAGVLFTIFGAHAVVWGVVTVSLRQRTVSGELIGRVNSVYNLFRMGGVAIGALIGGLAQAYGITAPFWFAGITVSLLAVFVWRYFDYQTENILHYKPRQAPFPNVGSDDD